MKLENYTPKMNARNKAFVKKLEDLAASHSIIGVVDVTSLPAPQFQRIRASLNKTATVLIVKRNLIELVVNKLEKSHKGISELAQKCQGVVGLVFTNDNPFTLYKFVQKNKSQAPAKAGQVAPNDIVVPAGPTNFSPGPIIGELGAFKIKAGINAGKVEIKEDSVVAKEGEEISAPLAGILTRLGIEPMEVGLNIKAIYEGGTIYTRDILDVDEEAVLNDLKACASNASSLAIGLEYFTKDNIKHFIGSAGQDALSLGVGIAWPEAETIKSLLSKANAHMAGVSSKLPEDIRPAGVTISTPVAAQTTSAANEGSEQKEEEKKEEEPADAAAGLGALF